MSEAKIVGLELSASNLIAVFVDAGGAIIDSMKTPFDFSVAGVPGLFSFVAGMKEKFGGFDKIGLAVPGLIDRATNRVLFSVHNQELKEIDLASEFKSQAGIEAILENDANSAAFAEFKLGAGRESRNMFYVTLGLGVGGALIVNGELWRGASGFAGEFGYITINSEGMKLEEMASSANIIRRIKSRFHQDHTSSLVKIGEEKITLADVVREAVAGDDFAVMMLERTGHYVGIGIASVVNLLNIERIVIGGEIMQAGNIVLDAIIARTRELSFTPSFEAANICHAELGDLSPAVGAALLCQN